MSAENRIDRLERVMKLVVRAGLRERRDTRDKINALIDAQLRTEQIIAEQAARTDAALQRLAESQTHTDHRLDALIDLVQGRRNGQG